MRAGCGLGKTIGVPTANLILPEGFSLLHGVYAVRVTWQGQSSLRGVANVGVRPTVSKVQGQPWLEVHLVDGA